MIHQDIFSLFQAIKIFRHYGHLRTDILQKQWSGTPEGKLVRVLEIDYGSQQEVVTTRRSDKSNSFYFVCTGEL